MSTCWKWESSGGGTKLRNYGSIVQVELTKLNSLLGRTDQQKKKRVRRWMIRGKVCRYEVSCQDFWGMLHLPRICCCRAVGKGQRLFSCCWISHQQQSLPSRSPLPWTHVFVFLFWILWLLRFGMKQSCHNREGRGKGHIWNLFLESNKTYNNSRRWRRRRWEKLNVVHHQYTTLYSLTLLTPFTANDNRNGDVSLSLSLSLSFLFLFRFG